MTISHLTLRWDDGEEVDRRGMVDAQGFIDDSRKLWQNHRRVGV